MQDERSFRDRFDVLVIGAGPAGIAASIAAARGGAETVLVEQASRPGGNVYSANVHTICGLFENDSDRPEPLNRGFPHHFARQLFDRGGAREPKRVGDVYVLPIFPGDFSDLAQQRTTDEPRLTILLNTRLCSVDRDRDNWIARVKRRSESSSDDQDARTALHGRLLLDTSGDACAAHMAGAECLQAPVENVQIPSFIVELSGIPDSYLEGFKKLRIQHSVAEGVREGELPPGCESVLLRPGPEPGTGYMTLNMPRNFGNTFDPFDRDSVQMFQEEARKRSGRIVDVLRRKNEDFRRLEIVSYPSQLGIRETRRLKGKTVLDSEHVLHGNHSPSRIARSGWPIELWENYEQPQFRMPDAPCDVPLECLVSETYPDLGAAGRCISSTREALGALRVIGTSMATGEALGFAAALAGPDGDLSSVRANEVRELRRDEFPPDGDDFF